MALSDKDAKKIAEAMAKALKNAEKVESTYSKAGKNLDKQSRVWTSITEQLFGLGESSFFDKIEHSEDYVQQLSDALKDTQQNIDELGVSLNASFNTALNSLPKGFEEKLFSQIDKFISVKSPEMGAALKAAIEKGNLTGFIQDFGDEGVEVFKKLVKGKHGFEEMRKLLGKEKGMVKDMQDLVKNAKDLKGELEKDGKEFFSWKKTLTDIGKIMLESFSLAKIKDSLLEFDQTITETQRDTGIAMKENTLAFTELTMKSAEFGLSVKDTAGLMAKLGDTMKTTNFGILSKAASDMVAFSKATGISVEEVGELGGQMMFWGASTEDVKEAVQGAAASAATFGVNVKKVTSEVAKNIPKWRQMAFKEGELSLARLSAKAEKLGITVDSVLKSAEAFQMNLEQSVDSAAQLQLIGGSFSNIDPFSMLSAAQEGGEAWTNMLQNLTADIGHINEKGEFQLTPVDRKRMQMAADALHIPFEELSNLTSQAKLQAEKTSLFPSTLFQGMDEESKQFLLQATDLTSKSVTIDGKVFGIDELSKLTPDMIKAATADAKNNKSNLEEQAKQNMSFQESVSALKTAVMTIFTYLEPVVKWLTSVIQSFSAGLAKMHPILKGAIAGLIGAGVLLFGFAKQFASGFAFGKGHNAALQGGGFLKNITGMFGKGSKIPGVGAGKSLIPEGVGKVPTGAGPGGFLGSLALGIKAFGRIDMKDLLKFATAMTIVGAGLIGFTVALASIGGEASLAQLGTAGASLVLLGGSMWLMSKLMKGVDMSGILKGSLAMALIGVALIPFAFAMQMLNEISWEALAKAGVGIIGLGLIVLGLGAIMMTGVGAALLGLGMVALLGLGLTMLVVGKSFQVAAPGFIAMSTVDWGKIMGAGPALLSLVGAGALSLFAVPGLLLMTFALGALAAVMVVLSPALSMASQSMIKMADGIDKLKEAVKGLDTSKLESLSDTAEKLATASVIGNLATAINALSGGGGGGKPQTIKIEPININLKLNGRQLQEIIVSDVQHVT